MAKSGKKKDDSGTGEGVKEERFAWLDPPHLVAIGAGSVIGLAGFAGVLSVDGVVDGERILLGASIAAFGALVLLLEILLNFVVWTLRTLRWARCTRPGIFAGAMSIAAFPVAFYGVCKVALHLPACVIVGNAIAFGGKLLPEHALVLLFLAAALFLAMAAFSHWEDAWSVSIGELTAAAAQVLVADLGNGSLRSLWDKALEVSSGSPIWFQG